MKTLWSNPRAQRVALASIAFWLLFGWLYGDDLLWTVVRALAATVTIFVIVASLAWTNAVVRAARVALGLLLGGYCAYALGASMAVVLATAAVSGALLAGCEYLIWRDDRREAEVR